jgi:MutS domain V
MRAQLLIRDGEFDWSKPLPWNAETLESDLSLHTLFTAMADNDPTILEAVQKVVFGATTSVRETILFRQDVIRESLHHEAMVRELYTIATEAMEKAKKRYLGSTLSRYPHWLLGDAVEQMEIFAEHLRRVRIIADRHSRHFRSQGWVSFFGRLQDELDDAYFQTMAAHLRVLKMRGPTLLSAGLNNWSRPADYVLHNSPAVQRRNIWQRLWTYFFPPKPSSNSFSIHPRDEAGARALGRIHDEGIAFATVALAQAYDHVRDFFHDFQLELAFYLGTVNLYRQLTGKGEPVCFPIPVDGTEPLMSFQGLYDASLALTLKKPVVGNTIDASTHSLVVITGANQGGKSTFLRSVGLAQLMMQAGLFVGADTFNASLSQGIFTHYKREESAALESGKFDEELSRMSEIADHISPRAMVLFNESFAATNEREGSEVGYQILNGLLDSDVRVICVTHLYDLARRLFEEKKDTGLFLQPERLPDGTRTFRLVNGEPLPTSFGDDLFRAIFSSRQPSSRDTVAAGHG